MAYWHLREEGRAKFALVDEEGRRQDPADVLDEHLEPVVVSLDDPDREAAIAALW